MPPARRGGAPSAAHEAGWPCAAVVQGRAGTQAGAPLAEGRFQATGTGPASRTLTSAGKP